jgi:hypothetical protein
MNVISGNSVTAKRKFRFLPHPFPAVLAAAARRIAQPRYECNLDFTWRVLLIRGKGAGAQGGKGKGDGLTVVYIGRRGAG